MGERGGRQQYSRASLGMLRPPFLPLPLTLTLPSSRPASPSPSILLPCSKNNFERAEMDEFVVETADVGKILKLQIGHDDS